MLVPKAKCSRCKRRFRFPHSNGVSICFSCGLYGVILNKCFDSIVKQPDMLKFEAEMDQWYAA